MYCNIYSFVEFKIKKKSLKKVCFCSESPLYRWDTTFRSLLQKLMLRTLVQTKCIDGIFHLVIQHIIFWKIIIKLLTVYIHNTSTLGPYNVKNYVNVTNTHMKIYYLIDSLVLPPLDGECNSTPILVTSFTSMYSVCFQHYF